MEIDMNKISEKWGKIVEDIKNNLIEDEYQKLTKEEKLCLYAEYHTLNESSIYGTLTGNGMGSINSCEPIKESKPTLPISLKILTGLSFNNDFKKIFIVPSPIYVTKTGRKIPIDGIEFSKPIDKNLPNLDQVIDDMIYKSTLEYLNSKTDKMIYIYNMIQYMRIIEDLSNGVSTLLWTTRITIE